ncbi:MAG: hypothetical protein JJ896_16765 [Rhodothermales bacterium]|nr:hypothetical protein [Rhodothermales bacterium]MBO6781311.1 hypothetical protein [Rhodothermales bacterium]
MRHLLFFVPFLVLGVSCQTITEPDVLGEGNPDSDPQRLEVVGYHAWWSGEAWRDYDFNALDGIYFFSLEIGKDGRIENDRAWPEGWQALIATARATDTEVIPSVTILDPDTYRAVFSDTAAVAALKEEIVNLATDVSADGVHLDFEMFERVDPEIRQAVTDLVAEARAEMRERREDTQLTMYMLAEDPADVLDEAAIAPHLDKLIVQAYDLHWQHGDQAGPVAPISGWAGRNWNGILTRFLGFGVDPEKMLFTVPYFGYEWPTMDYLPGARTTGPGTILAYGKGPEGIPSARDRAAEYGKLRDAESGSPYYAYRDSIGDWHQGWFEDAESIAQKYLFASGEGLAGVAIFPLAYGDRELLVTLTAAREQLQTGVSP